MVLLGLIALAACGRVEEEEAPAAPVQEASMEATWTCDEGCNLLRNPGFEKGRELPDDWRRDAFIYRDDLFAWDKNKSFRGHASVRVSIPLGMPNDARWIQSVPVEPHTRYRLSGWIKTRDVAHTQQLADVGANLSILDTNINLAMARPEEVATSIESYHVSVDRQGSSAFLGDLIAPMDVGPVTLRPSGIRDLFLLDLRP